MSKLPEIINNFNVYLAGNKLIGVSGEVELPSFEAITETLSGAGILGEYDVVNPGQFSAQELTIPFRVLYGDAFSLFAKDEEATVTLRGSIQTAMTGTGARKYEGAKVYVKGQVKTLKAGKLAAGKPMDSEVTLALNYIEIVAGSNSVELDRINSIFKVNGVDKLAAISSKC